MNNLNNEFLNRIKTYLNDENEYKKFLDSFSLEPKNGLMLNRIKLNNNLNLLNTIINNLNLELIFENDR